MQSEAWQVVRRAYFANRPQVCAVCTETRGLQLHHRTYVNLFWEESHLDDLVALCQKHHRAISAANRGAAKRRKQRGRRA